MSAQASTTTTLPLAPGRWAVDPNHSSVGFVVRHFGVSKVRGRFSRFDVDVVVGETLEDSRVSATIDVSSIDTGNGDRDAHVLSPDILDVARRPTIDFRSGRVTAAGSDYRIDGTLTIGDVSRPVSLAVAFGGLEAFPDGTRHAGFEATTEIRRQDFGLAAAIPAGFLGDAIKVELDLQLIEPQAQG